MDKFDRRPDRKSRRRLIARFGLIAGAVLIWFVVLFAFGNAAVPWLSAVYGTLLLYIAVLSFEEGHSAVMLVWSDAPIQSIQGPGFTALEVAALEALVPQRRDRSAMLAAAEVVLRWNTGAGCLTAMEAGPDQKRLALGDTPQGVAWFKVVGIDTPVGCRLWPATPTEPALLDFFCGGERTVDIDWATVPFVEAAAGPVSIVPAKPPAFDINRVMTAMEQAFARLAEHDPQAMRS